MQKADIYGESVDICKQEVCEQYRLDSYRRFVGYIQFGMRRRCAYAFGASERRRGSANKGVMRRKQNEGCKRKEENKKAMAGILGKEGRHKRLFTADGKNVPNAP